MMPCVEIGLRMCSGAKSIDSAIAIHHVSHVLASRHSHGLPQFTLPTYSKKA